MWLLPVGMASPRLDRDKNPRSSFYSWLPIFRGFPGGSDGKASACNAGDPWVGKTSGEGNGNSLQYSCLETSMDGGAWWATVYGVRKTQAGLSDFTFIFSELPEKPANLPHLRTPWTRSVFHWYGYLAAIFVPAKGTTDIMLS